MASKIMDRLKLAGAYQEGAPGKVTVSINSLHIRSPFESAMAGMLASENMGGVVTLKNGTMDLATFNVTSSLRVNANNVTPRLDLLSGNFAGQVVKMIMGNK